MIRLTGNERFTVLRGGQPVSVRLRDLDFLQVLALANLHRDDKRLFPALMARQYRMRLAHDRGRPAPAYGGDDDGNNGGRAA